MDWRPYFPTPWCCRRFQPSAILASWDHQLKCAWGRCWVSKSRTTWRSGVKRTFLEVNQRQHEPKDSQCHASIFRHKIWNIFHSFTLAGIVAGKVNRICNIPDYIPIQSYYPSTNRRLPHCSLGSASSQVALFTQPCRWGSGAWHRATCQLMNWYDP